eukprot:SAG11_NODE_1319_length_5209_cov_10.314873_7_plen_39_part_00
MHAYLRDEFVEDDWVVRVNCEHECVVVRRDAQLLSVYC